MLRSPDTVLEMLHCQNALLCGFISEPLASDGRLSVFVHFALVAEAEGADVFGLSGLVSVRGGADVEERWRGGVARLSIMKPLPQEQHVTQVTDVTARQAQSLDL